MPDTPHIKRFEEWEKEAYRIAKQAGDVKIETQAEVFASKMMLDDLAEHVERLEEQFKNHRHLDNGSGFSRTSQPIPDDELPPGVSIDHLPTDPTQDGNHTTKK